MYTILKGDILQQGASVEAMLMRGMYLISRAIKKEIKVTIHDHFDSRCSASLMNI